MKTMKSSKPIFITGCDNSQKWMLPWLEKNFEKYHGDTDLYILDFEMMFPELPGWFKKPATMIHCSTWAPKVCWIDVDCEIKGNLDGIFNYTEYNKLTIAVDLPWTKRRPNRGRWYNSGVVAFETQPSIPAVLYEWNRIIVEGKHKEVGDQEVLNWMMGNDPLKELTHLAELPRIYNTLRLDLKDKTAPKDPKIIHWTGPKGKDQIRKIMND